MSTYIRITHNILIAFILLKTLVQPIYIQYYIQHYCEEHPDRRILIGSDGNYSTLILRSSNSETVSNQICQIKIIGENIGGIIAVVNNISLNNGIENCDNYLKIDDQNKWCNDDDYEKSLAFNKTELIIEFGTGFNSTSQFELVLTTFSGLWNRMCTNPNNIRCHGGNQECIYKGLECDGYHNCPSGSDEEHCPDLQPSELVDEEPIEEINTNTTLKNEINGNETTLQPIITNGTTFETSSQPLTSVVTVITPITPITITVTITSFVSSTESTTQETNATTHHSNVHPLNGGQTTAIILVVVCLVAIVSGSAIYMYKKHADNRETLYSPL